MNKNIDVQGISISVKKSNMMDYISLTDIAKYKSSEPKDVVKNWLRSKDTIQILGLWESINNLNFNRVEFDSIKNESGTNAFTLSPKRWIENTNAIGLISSAGRYGGTYAHQDIAFEFASWVSAEFKLYLIKEFQSLFSTTAKEWRGSNLDKKGNIRDYATIEQLLVLANLESLNSEYIKACMSQKDRLLKLNKVAIEQMKVLTNNKFLPDVKKNF